MSSNYETLVSEVKSSIEKALPSMQVDVFRRHVEEHDKLRKDYDKLKTDYDTLKADHVKCSAELSTLRALNLEAEKIKMERATLELDKTRFDVTKQLKDADVKIAEAKAATVFTIVDSVFRNTHVRSRIFGDVPVINKDPNGNQWTSTQKTELDQTSTQE